MQIHGRLLQGDNESTVDETLFFASKTNGSRNFYLGLVAAIPASSSFGYLVPYNGVIQSFIGTTQNVGTARKAATFSIRNLNTNQELGLVELPAGENSTYQPKMRIEIAAGTMVGIYLASSANQINPIARLLISKK